MTDNLRDRIAAAIEDALTTGEVSASGYGREFVRLDGDDIVTLDGTFNLTALGGAVIRELKLEAEDGECGYCQAQLPGCRYVTEWTAYE